MRERRSRASLENVYRNQQVNRTLRAGLQGANVAASLAQQRAAESNVEQIDREIARSTIVAPVDGEIVNARHVARVLDRLGLLLNCRALQQLPLAAHHYLCDPARDRALGSLALTHQTLNLFSLIGTVLLVGLATKNGILLVDYADMLRRQGRDRLEAIRESAATRFRPIFMTTFAMIGGMLPLAFALEPGVPIVHSMLAPGSVSQPRRLKTDLGGAPVGTT